MKISTTDKEITIIEFSRDELEACRITYENISRDVRKSKTVIYKIISETAKISEGGKSVDENTLIDILPDGDGGCIIILNNTPKKGERGGTAVYTGDDINAFIDFAVAMPDKELKSSLYKADNQYYLCVPSEGKLIRLAGEFLLPVTDSPVQVSRLCECAELIIGDNALKVLSGTASEK